MGTTEQTTRILQSLEKNILSNSDSKHFIDAVDEMFDSFMNDKDGPANNGDTRSDVFYHYKNLKAFLMELP
jgi:hypothetical protein